MSARQSIPLKLVAGTSPSFASVHNGLLQRKCACGGTPGPTGECEECRKKRERILQRYALDSAGPKFAPSIVHDVLRSPGQPLDPETRNFMEPRFGHDFSEVRLHTDAKAAESARAVNALAYTIGRDVVFGESQYAPKKRSGQRLLAHELTHVIQQAGGPTRYATEAENEAALESEANKSAASIHNDVEQLAIRYRHGGARLARLIGQESGPPTSLGLGQQSEPPTSLGGGVQSVEISCAKRSITFYTPATSMSYELTECDLSEGAYEATVSVERDKRGEKVRFMLDKAPAEGVRFHFNYDVKPGQANPATLVRNGQRVRVVAHKESEAAVVGSTEGVLDEIPVTFVAIDVTEKRPASPGEGGEFGPAIGRTLGTIGLGTNVLASGDLSWLSNSAAARRVLSPEYWDPFIPSPNRIPLDRVLNEIPQDLAPGIQAELAAGRPLSWVRRGFSEEELVSIPDLVRRLNESGLDNLSPAEIQFLRRAAAIHVGGSTPGSPFASYSQPGFNVIPSVGNRKFRVRVEVPRTQALDVSRPTAFTQGTKLGNILNEEEAELLVVANHEGRLISVERLAGGGEPALLLRYSGAIRWGGRIVFVAGAALSAYRIAQARPEERHIVAGEEIGGQFGGFIGTAGAVAGCALLGIATGGVGLFLCGLAGGIALGAAGSALGGTIARQLGANGGPSRPMTASEITQLPRTIGGHICPSCHALQREWEQRLEFRNFPGSYGRRGDLLGIGSNLTPEEMLRLQGWLEGGRPH